MSHNTGRLLVTLRELIKRTLIAENKPLVVITRCILQYPGGKRWLQVDIFECGAREKLVTSIVSSHFLKIPFCAIVQQTLCFRSEQRCNYS